MIGSVRVAAHLAARYRATWSTSVFVSFLSPVVVLAALGFGLGQLVEGGAAATALGGRSYRDFVGPALLVTAATQLAAQESSWPVVGAVRHHHLYLSITATPVRPAEVPIGHSLWVAARLTLQGSVFVLVLWAAGIAASPTAVAAVAVAVVTGVAIAASFAAWAVTLEWDQPIALMWRLGLTPAVMMSGTFFPIDQLPAGLGWAVRALPIWHGTEACRALVLGAATWSTVGHVAYVAAWSAVALVVAGHTYSKRLAA